MLRIQGLSHTIKNGLIVRVSTLECFVIDQGIGIGPIYLDYFVAFRYRVNRLTTGKNLSGLLNGWPCRLAVFVHCTPLFVGYTPGAGLKNGGGATPRLANQRGRTYQGEFVQFAL